MQLPRRTAARSLVAVLLLSTLSPASAFADTSFSFDTARNNLTYVAAQLASFFSDFVDAITSHIPGTSLAASAAAPTPSPIAPPAPALDFLATTTPEASTPPTTSAAPDAPQTTIIQQPVIERIVERTVPAPAASGISEQTLAGSLASLKDDLLLRIAAVASAPIAFSGPAPTTPVSTATFAPSQRIDQLTNSAINTPTITGGAISGASSVGASSGSFDALSAGTLNLSGELTGTDATFSGTLSAGTLNVAGLSSQGALVGPYFTATSTTATSTFAGGFTAASSTFNILQNGNVGIGTAAPTRQFQVYNNQNASTKAAVTNPNTGTGALSQFSVEAAGNTSYLYSFGSGYTTSGRYIASSGLLETSGSSGLGLSAVAGDMRFYTSAGAERLRVTSAGNVGIGTTSPTNKLEVAGNTFLGGTITGTSTLALTGTTGTTTIASGQGFTIGSSQFVVQQGSGNVGIGTASPVAVLSVQAASGRYLRLGTASSFTDYIQQDTNQFGWLTYTGQYLQSFDLANGRMSIGAAGSAPLSTLDVLGNLAVGSYAGTAAAPSNGLIVSGNVGIGTTTPDARLIVSGTGQSTANLSTSANLGASLVLSDTNVAGAVGSGGSLIFGGTGSAGNLGRFAAIKGLLNNSSSHMELKFISL